MAQPEKGKKKWAVKEGEKSESNAKANSKPPFQKQPKPDKKKQPEDKSVSEEQEAAVTPAVPSKAASQGPLVKVFSFPGDGKQFVLDPSKEYRIRVNNSFWVML